MFVHKISLEGLKLLLKALYQWLTMVSKACYKELLSLWEVLLDKTGKFNISSSDWSLEFLMFLLLFGVTFTIQTGKSERKKGQHIRKVLSQNN